MKLNRLFSVVTILMLTQLAFTANAQEESKGKPNVFIDYFWRASGISASDAEQLRNQVIQVINETHRVNLIDVDTNSSLQIEKERRESGNLAADDDLDRMKVMEQQGANFLIQGTVTSLAIEHKKTDSGSDYYTAVINFTLKVINPNDGITLHTESFKAGGELLNLQTGDTPEEAVMNVCKTGAKKIKPFIEKAFPIFGKVLEMDEIKKDEVKSIFISVGSSTGVKEKDKFEVKVVREIAGRKSAKTIGEVEVSAVEGDDISAAKVKKGGKEIKAAIDGGQTVIVESIAKKANIFSGAAI